MVAVAHFEVVVDTVVVVLDLERLELEGHLKVLGNRDLPNALFVGPVVLWIVRTLKSALLCVDLTAA